ncbi:cytochrome c oxidase subunit 3 [Roseivirga pacifica]|uniref:Cytochrome c oxidase subunit 3 n=1 Tax=Roseivirga pacifica TaxID=1267423 RepID=A0A1I0MWD4_9BACT|nr:cytochrome C oxidase subunit III [Roseivirga pacifica]RKQ50723.1 cytochrome c oxidase subunit 3 [Roseivirga pacifica]SEV92586.1 cytochrome c oxidase subunit 3 [Roseivirga pacifica]
MPQEKKRVSLRRETFKKMEELHPHQIILFVAMVGSGILFFFLLVAFAVARPPQLELIRMEFPKSFVVSTFVMLLSSFSVAKVLPMYKADNQEELKKWLGITFLLGLAFSTLQFLGWRELQSHQILFSGERSGAYLYVLSGLHVAHVLGIMVYLLYLLMQCHKTSKDAVKELLYATNPYQKVRFKLLTSAWHFVDVVWVVVFFYFLFSF